MDLLADLTPEQRQAVSHMEGPLLVLAGAGSGKTRVITRRVAYLIDQGCSPRNILAVTFTNKAAGEMAERIAQLVPHSSTRLQPVWVTTFHKFCARMLRMYGERVGLGSGYVIYDTTDRLKVIKDALGKVGIDRSLLPPDRVEYAISRAKNDLLDPEAYAVRASDHFQANVARAYRVYQQVLLQANAVDFDDLLLYVATLLRDYPDLRREIDERYRFILVDEYQDTNLAQYAIVRALSTDSPNLCVTGDPDQSIYGWRGANLNNILQFEEDFPNTRVVRLEKNYRSTQRILTVASHLIQFNRRRKHKDLYTDNPEGLPVQVALYADGQDEARSIARRIRADADSGGRPYSDFAVFCRVAALTRTLEMAFLAEQVPYQVLSGVGFFERAEVKDLLAYLKLLVNPHDDVSFSRIVNVPPRGIGKSTLDRVQAEASRLGLSFLETARRADQVASIKPRQIEALGSFVRLVDDLRVQGGHCVEETMRQVLKRTGYLDEISGTACRQAAADVDSPDANSMTGDSIGAPPIAAGAEERIANIEELLTAAHQFDQDNAGGDLVQFLSETALTTDLDVWDPDHQAVSLMTLHAAKGLEFPVVYIVAIEHGILPHQRAIDQADGDLEEERRLLFVGMTRAKEELHLSYVRHREFRGQSLPAILSQFLLELPQTDCVEKRGAAGRAASFEAGDGLEPWDQETCDAAYYSRPTSERLAARPAIRIRTAAELARSRARSPAQATEFCEGMLVLHPEYGLGRISQLSGYGDRRKATVRFTVGGTRSFMLAQSPLRPVRPPQNS